MSQRIASGHGLATISLSGAVLDTWFPEPMLGNLSNPVIPFLSALAGVDEIRGVKREVVSLEIDLDKAPESVSDAYLRLHLLSHRVIKPHGANVDGIFAILNNVVWTSVGPCPVENFEITRAKLKQKYGAITVLAVDKWTQELQDRHIFDKIEGTKVPHEGIVIKYFTGERQKVAKVINPDYLIYGEKNDVGDSH